MSDVPVHAQTTQTEYQRVRDAPHQVKLTYGPFIGVLCHQEYGRGEMNNIILHSIPNRCTKQAHLQGLNFKAETYRTTINILK